MRESMHCPTTKLVVKRPGAEGRFVKQWKWDPKKRRLENARLGAAVQVVDVVAAKGGRVHHEAILLFHRRAELCVVVRRRDGAIGLVFHRREGLVPPKRILEIARRDSRALPKIEDVKGISEYECPHGLAHRPLAEVLEEIGFKVHRAERIGFIKDDTGLGGSLHLLYAVEVDGESSGQCPEPGEQIMSVAFFTPEKICAVKTVCGLTQAALWRFRVWGLKQKSGIVWRKAAERL